MTRLIALQWGYLTGKRTRYAGPNARLGDHGIEIREPVAKITLDDGSTGFGVCVTTPEQAQSVLGQSLDALITPENGVAEQARFLDFTLWDLLGKRANKPVYALLNASISAPFRVPCYDTSLYFDDLQLEHDNDGAALIADEARQGYARGHRAFKIKVGRGAMHMPLEAGIRRDIAIIQAVRAAVGADAPLMIDANNGYNVNIVKQILAATSDCHLYWFEEPFHEDDVLYAHLHDWMKEAGLSVFLADGEADAAPRLMDWARDGLVDVVQHDVRQHGFSRWLEYARQHDAWGVRSAPHNYGSAFGEYASCHLAAAIQHFTFVESDRIELEGLDASGYRLHEGMISVPDAAGFGLALDESALQGGFLASL
jgi:L-rhamnonate dehydratase